MEKVQFGIKNVKYALKTVNADGTVTFGAPVALPGATEIALPPVGEIVKKYADNVLYVRIPVNQGYDGTLSVFYVPDSFARDVLGMTFDQNGVLVEGSGAAITEFALMGEFDTDTTRKKRWLMYNCTAGRSDLNGATKEDTVDPQAFSIPITAAPLDGTEVIKASYLGDDSDPIFASWLSSVYVPSEAVQKRVEVTVTKTGGTAVFGALVVCGGKFATTEANGKASFMLPTGKHDVMVSASGLTAAVDSVTVANADVTKTVTLTVAS